MPPIEQVINRQLLEAKVGELLYQLGIIPDNQIITKILFSDLFGDAKGEFIHMKIFPRKEQGVKVISHNAMNG